jgi:hypothetical protein
MARCDLAKGVPFFTRNMAKRTNYQQRVIRNYYENLDLILVQRLGDLVSDLYLAEGTKRVRLWKRTADALTKLKVPAARIQHIVQSDNPTLVANLLKELLDKPRP